MRGQGLVLPLLLLLANAGCQEQVYTCHSDANCVLLGVQGRCLSAGVESYCAFPSPRCAAGRIYDKCCPSGLSWDESAPMIIEKTCVDPSLLSNPDGGTD